MSEYNIKKLKKQIIYRCLYTGTKETDLLYQKLIVNKIDTLSSNERKLYDRLNSYHDWTPDDIDRFTPRMSLLSRYGISNLVKREYKKKTVFMRTLWGDGSEITKAETQAILDATWKGSTLFNWRKGDLLLLDNIRCGHGRMNVTQPRRIAAALGDTYSLDEMTEYKQGVSA